MNSKTDGFYIGACDTTYLTCKGAVEMSRSENNGFTPSGNGVMYANTSSLHWYAGIFNATGLTIDRIQI